MAPILLRVVGGALLLLVLLPLDRLAPPGTPGSPAEHLRLLASGYRTQMLLGLIGTAAVALPLGFARWPRRFGDRLAARLRAALLAPSRGRFACGVALGAGAATLLLSRWGFALRPALLDATSQLVHARYLAAGRLAGPAPALPEFHLFQFSLLVPAGWASQYPPGHLAALAVGWLAGAPWLVGPLLAAATAGLTALVAEELLPDDRPAARLGAVFFAGSLFWLAHAASYMSHVTAAAAGALAVLGALRGGAGGPRAVGWLVASGFGAAAALATRPVAGLVAGAVALLCLFARRARPTGVLWMALGSLPAGLALGWYNQRLFGSPFRFGYLAAEGPGHALGFHFDPWGERFGPLEGLVRTARDLVALGQELLLTPLSATLVVAAYLLLARAPPRGLRVLLSWALLPVAAHFFYWHQDLFLGPRLLADFAAPWALLLALAGIGLLRRARAAPPARWDRYAAAVVAVGVSVAVGVAVLIPARLALIRGAWGAPARVEAPAAEGPALVFVPVGWGDRLGARLAGRGVRVDSVRALLRHNTSCELQRALDAGGGRGVPPGVRTRATAGRVVAEVRLAPAVTVRTYRDEPLTAECRRQARADRGGALPFPELFAGGDLPGLGGDGTLFARDLGPERNAALLTLHPGRRPWVLVRPQPAAEPVLLPYAAGMRRVWGE